MLRSTLLTEAGFIHAVSDASFGNLSFTWDTDGSAVKNRVRFLTAAGVTIEECVSMSLVHGDTVLSVSSNDRGRGMADPATHLPSADAFITKDPDLFLFMLTADCLPVSIVDPITGHCALLHCGWRSIDAHLPQKAVSMLTEAGSNVANLLVHFGPSILTYIFTHEKMRERTAIALTDWSPYCIDFSDGTVRINASAYAKAQLLDAGVRTEHIEESDIDTATDTEYFSHCRSVRNGEPEARFATILGRRSGA